MKRSLLASLSLAFLRASEMSNACSPKKDADSIPAGPCLEESIERETPQVAASELALFYYSAGKEFHEFQEFPGEVSHALPPETRADHQTARCAYKPRIRRFLLYAEIGRVTAAYRVNFLRVLTISLQNTLPVGWWRKPKPAPLT